MSEATKRARAMLATALLPKSAKDVMREWIDQSEDQEKRMQAVESALSGLVEDGKNKGAVIGNQQKLVRSLSARVDELEQVDLP
jgi:hypothetical protein